MEVPFNLFKVTGVLVLLWIIGTGVMFFYNSVLLTGLVTVLGGTVFYLVIVRSVMLGFTQKFKCLQCGDCCRMRVLVSENDIVKLEANGKRKREDFLDPDALIPMLKFADNKCHFLTEKGGLAFCKAYKDRPKICQNFPRLFKLPIWDIGCRFYRDKLF